MKNETKTETFVITISHQIGSGGSYLGRKLSEHLGVPFIDRQVLQAVAEQLNLSETQLRGRDEKLRSFWQILSQLAAFTDPMASLAPSHFVLTDKELFQLESEYIGGIGEKTSAIFL